MSRKGDYEVGYGKPPVATRFKKGQSPYPQGRAKGSRNLAQLIERELDQPLTITENGRRRSITKREAVAKQLVNRAVAGDPKAMPFLAQGRHGEAGPDGGEGTTPVLADEDQKVLLTALQRLRSSTPGEGQG
jgi:hypothetical protein